MCAIGVIDPILGAADVELLHGYLARDVVASNDATLEQIDEIGAGLVAHERQPFEYDLWNGVVGLVEGPRQAANEIRAALVPWRRS